MTGAHWFMQPAAFIHKKTCSSHTQKKNQIHSQISQIAPCLWLTYSPTVYWGRGDGIKGQIIWFILYKDLVSFASCVHFGFVEVPPFSFFNSGTLLLSFAPALFCIFESFACKPCSLVLPALWRGGDESPTSIVLMSKLEWRRFETLLVFSRKIKIVRKLYIQIIAEIRPGKKKDFHSEDETLWF